MFYRTTPMRWINTKKKSVELFVIYHEVLTKPKDE